MEHSENMGELAKALCKCQAEMKPAKFNKHNAHYNSNYADLNSVWDACREPMRNNDLVAGHVFRPSATPNCVDVVCILEHWPTGKKRESVLTTPYGVGKANETKVDPQGMGIGITYGKRFTLAAIVGVVCDEDTDGEGVASSRGAAAPPATRPLRDDRAPASPRAEPDTGRSRQGPIPIPPLCPTCGGPMWDNRDRRAAAEAKWVAEGSPDPKPNFQPAWKCKDGKWDSTTRTASGCPGKIFPSDPNEEKGKRTGSVPARRADLEPRDDDQKPLTDADIPF